MQTLNTEYKPMQHEEMVISVAGKTSVTGAAAVDTIEVDGIPVACLEPDGTVAWLSNATDDIKRNMEIG